MEKKTFNFAMALMFGASIFFCLSCGNSTSKKDNFEIVHQKKFGLSHITMCLVTDTSDAVLIEIGKNIAADNNSAYVFFYTDRSKIKDITLSNDLLDAIPGDGFFAKYSTSDGFVKNVNTFVAEPPKGPVTITLIEKKTRNSIYTWYTYYVENYTDTKETNDKMIAIAQKAPYSNVA